MRSGYVGIIAEPDFVFSVALSWVRGVAIAVDLSARLAYERVGPLGYIVAAVLGSCSLAHWWCASSRSSSSWCCSSSGRWTFCACMIIGRMSPTDSGFRPMLSFHRCHNASRLVFACSSCVHSDLWLLHRGARLLRLRLPGAVHTLSSSSSSCTPMVYDTQHNNTKHKIHPARY